MSSLRIVTWYKITIIFFSLKQQKILFLLLPFNVSHTRIPLIFNHSILAPSIQRQCISDIAFPDSTSTVADNPEYWMWDYVANFLFKWDHDMLWISYSSANQNENNHDIINNTLPWRRLFMLLLWSLFANMATLICDYQNATLQ